jgi:hypothetical protein
MGFQRETASRGSLAMYTSVCLPPPHGEKWKNGSTVIDRVCRHVRVHRVWDNTYPPFDGWRDHNHKLGYLYFRNIPSLSFISTKLVLMCHS